VIRERRKMEKKIYIAAPSCIATGGPELLHQLCYKLNKFGFDSKMLYYANSAEYLNVKNPVHPNYEEYHNPYTQTLAEASRVDALVIIPEGALELINHIKWSKMVIWWLSVDNYYDSIELMCKKNIRNDLEKDVYNLREKDIIHFVQSYYAKDFVINQMKIAESKVYYLSDYLRKEFIKNKSNSCRKNYCLFNPKKGFENIMFLANLAPDLGWIPISNMTPEEVVTLMDESKVYIDFGNHPGKDRIPREAAMRGMSVITNKAGSAGYTQDVMIPEKYKFDNIETSAKKIIDLIRDIYIHYEEHEQQFDAYRKRITEEEKLFDDSIKEIFKELV